MIQQFDLSSIRKNFPILNKPIHNSLELHYLDNAATSQTPEIVQNVMREHDSTHRANVKRGVHHLAEKATDAYESSRRRVATYLNANKVEEIIFTSGTTGGINLLANCFGATLSPGDEIIISILEHHSNFVPWQMLRDRAGIVLKILPATEDGKVDVSKLDKLLTPRCRLISVTHASNVTGAITNLEKIVSAAKSVNALVAIDGAQMAPHGPIDVQSLGVDFYMFSAHKMFGPSGVGVLWGREEILNRLPPFMGGGEMIKNVTPDKTTYADIPARFEAGTPPITQAVGLEAAIAWIQTINLQMAELHMESLANRALDGLQDINKNTSSIQVLGPERNSNRLPVLSFSVRGAHPHDICQILDSRGVALRGGHHCAQPYMDSLGLTGTTRASIALYNNTNDIDAFLTGLDEALNILSND